MSRPSQARIDRAISNATLASDVTAKEIRGDGTTIRISRARWLAWKELRGAGFGYYAIAKAWGCNHTSIMHAERKGWGLEDAPVVLPPVMIWGPRLAQQAYEADRQEHSPRWEDLPPRSRQAYETKAPRWMEGHGAGASVRWVQREVVG